MFSPGKVAKIHLALNGEILTKRYVIDGCVSDPFKCLRDRVEAAFNLQNNIDWILCGKENGTTESYLPIRTQDDFNDYLCTHRGKKFTFFVDPCPKDFQGGASVSITRHLAILCDDCKVSVKGNRFKCIVCEDYDLCEECFYKGVHGDHDMLVIRRHDSIPAEVQKVLKNLSQVYRTCKMSFLEQEGEDHYDSYSTPSEKDPFSDDWTQRQLSSHQEPSQGKEEYHETNGSIDDDFLYRDELNKLCNMGYNNENKIIEFMLNQHNGDISKVIDLLSEEK